MSRAALRQRAYYRHWTKISTRWHDDDRYGHTNNVVYYGWIDTAVNEWLVANGLLDLAATELIGLVVASGCSYANALRFPQRIDVGLAVSAIGRSSVTYHVGIFAEPDASASAEGFLTHAYVSGAERRPQPLPERWRDVLAAILAKADEPSGLAGQIEER